MKILIDKKEIEIYYTDEDSLSEFIQRIIKNLEKEGRVIDSIRINGEEISLDFEDSLDMVDIIEFSTKKPNILIVETLHELDSYIDRFLENIDLVIEAIDFGEYLDAVDNLLEGINGLEWIFTVLENAKEILDIQAYEMEIIFEKAYEIMMALINALEEKNYPEIKRELSFNLCSLLMEVKDKIPFLSDLAMELEKKEIYSN